jgi:hypothetical protein
MSGPAGFSKARAETQLSTYLNEFGEQAAETVNIEARKGDVVARFPRDDKVRFASRFTGEAADQKEIPILFGKCAIAHGNRRASRRNVPAHVRRQGCSPLPPLDSTLTATVSPKRGGP